jgi:hypothetical protein
MAGRTTWPRGLVGGGGEGRRVGLSDCLIYWSIPLIRCLGELLSAERNKINERGTEDVTLWAVHTTPAPGGRRLIKLVLTKNCNHKCLYLYLVRYAAGGAVGWDTVLHAGKVSVSIPDGVIGISHWHNPCGRTMVLGLTQPLTEMSTTNISWGNKGGRCVGLTNLPPLCADWLEMREHQTRGNLRACSGL